MNSSGWQHNAAFFVAPFLLGAAVLLLMWGGKAWLLQKLETDTAWLSAVALRFNPNPDQCPRMDAGITTLFFLMMLILLMWLHPIFGALLWLIMLFFPGWIVEWAWRRRKDKIDEQLAPTISAMSNSIRAGLTLVQAVQRLAEQRRNRSAPNFRSWQIVMRTVPIWNRRSGKPRLAWALAEFPICSHPALLLNREMGGDVGQTLSRISLSLDKLHEMRQTVHAQNFLEGPHQYQGAAGYAGGHAADAFDRGL